jgi:hypothetical protein
MATGLLTDVLQVGSSHAKSVIIERNLKCVSIQLPVKPLAIWHAHCLQILYAHYKNLALKLNTVMQK